MRFVNGIYENVMEMLKAIPMFKKVLDRTASGDLIEKVDEMTFEDKCKPLSTTPDSFSETLNSIPSVDYTDKFAAIDRLNAAISGIKFESKKDEKE